MLNFANLPHSSTYYLNIPNLNNSHTSEHVYTLSKDCCTISLLLIRSISLNNTDYKLKVGKYTSIPTSYCKAKLTPLLISSQSNTLFNNNVFKHNYTSFC